MISRPNFLAERLRADAPLARYTAARLGGPADWLYVAQRTPIELAEVLAWAWDQKLPVRVLGGGANVLVSDHGVAGLVVINHASQIAIDDNRVFVWSGTNLSTLAQKLAGYGLSGFEWAVSVPGTVGGAVINNAGAHGGSMADNIETVGLIAADGTTRRLTRDELAYDYRTSRLKQRPDRDFLVQWAVLNFAPDDPAAIRARMAANIAQRKRTQPPGASLGSIFKNPPGDYAGRLIEASGLKGHAVGGAQVSPVHANFFINTGATTASAYHDLIEQVRATVKREQGVLLELEIELVGNTF